MSSPIHHAEDLDAALVHAPPRVRDEARIGAERRAAPPIAKPSMGLRFRGANPVFSGDRAISELQRRFTLDPDLVPDPPRSFARQRVQGKIALRMGGVAAAAALVAWVMISMPGASKLLWSENVPAGMPELQAALDRIAQDPTRALTMARLAPREEAAVTDEALQAAPPVQPHLEAKPAEPAGAAAESRPVATSPVPAEDRLRLDDGEIATLVKRGEDSFTKGDIASARLLLGRAAEAGSAKAALALGATFDPLVLRRLGAVGSEPDPARARKWYRKARELGSDTASERLAKLDQAAQ